MARSASVSAYVGLPLISAAAARLPSWADVGAGVGVDGSVPTLVDGVTSSARATPPMAPPEINNASARIPLHRMAALPAPNLSMVLEVRNACGSVGGGGIDDATREQHRPGRLVNDEEKERPIDDEPNLDRELSDDDAGGSRRGRALLVDRDVGLVDHVGDLKIRRSVDAGEVGGRAKRHP